MLKEWTWNVLISVEDMSETSRVVGTTELCTKKAREQLNYLEVRHTSCACCFVFICTWQLRLRMSVARSVIPPSRPRFPCTKA